MEILNKLAEIINIESEEPVLFGSLHILSLLAVIYLSLSLVSLFGGARDGVYRLIVGIAFFVMLTLEAFKQIAYPITIVDGEPVYDYVWRIFPFQLCSTPLYVFPFLVFLKDGHLRDMAAAYTMTFGLLGGIAVYVFPKTVFCTQVALNIQSMIHHGLQIVVGVYTAAYYRSRICFRYFLGAVGLFSGFYAIANLLNTVGYDFLASRGYLEAGEEFNMFFVSPREDQIVPVLDNFLGSLPPVIYIIGYFVAVVLGALILAFFAYRIGRFFDKRVTGRVKC